MLVFNSLKPFTRNLINYIGNGYIYCQVVKIPEKKTKKIKSIDKKITTKYLTDLSSGKRQYRKKKGLCNYKSLRFGNTIIILKTAKGEDAYKKEKWSEILGHQITFRKLSIVVFKDERDKITVRIHKSYLKEIMGLLELSISKKNQQEFNKAITFLYNLHKTLRYRGIQIQISQILKQIKSLQKSHGTKFQVPKFF